MSILENLLDDADVDPNKIAGEDTRNSINGTVSRDHKIDLSNVPDPEPSVIAETDADVEIPVREFESDPSQSQFDALERLELTDPFTLAVEASNLAGEESTDYAVTAFYDGFGDSPNDRLFGPTTPLDFDEDGIASVSIGSSGTDADVLTWIAFGSLSGDATLINNIEIPGGADSVAVETAEGTGQESVTSESGENGEFTKVETV